MSFRLPAILWAFSLLAASVVTVGPLGVLFAAPVIAFWGVLLKKFPPKLRELVVVLAILTLLAILLAPAIMAAREAANRAACFGHLAQFKHALLYHADARGTFPAAQQRLNPGDPPHSWRVALLPYLFSPNPYAQYNLAESWNSESNLRVAGTAIEDGRDSLSEIYFGCPSDPPTSDTVTLTHYFAVVGPQTAWPPDRGLVRSEIVDDGDRTILLLEVPNRDVPWTKPEDLTFDEAVEYLTQTPPVPAHSGKSVNVLFANGDYASLSLPLLHDVAVALLTINGGETIDPHALEPRPESALDGISTRTLAALAAFVTLAILPVVGVIRRRIAP